MVAKRRWVLFVVVGGTSDIVVVLVVPQQEAADNTCSVVLMNQTSAADEQGSKSPWLSLLSVVVLLVAEPSSLSLSWSNNGEEETTKKDMDNGPTSMVLSVLQKSTTLRFPVGGKKTKPLDNGAKHTILCGSLGRSIPTIPTTRFGKKKMTLSDRTSREQLFELIDTHERV